jgi:hypothetical protein
VSRFYKYESGQLHSGRLVLNLEYELHAETHGEHTYPVDGWYWFDTEQDARDFFGLPPADEDDR